MSNKPGTIVSLDKSVNITETVLTETVLIIDNALTNIIRCCPVVKELYENYLTENVYKIIDHDYSKSLPNFILLDNTLMLNINSVKKNVFILSEKKFEKVLRKKVFVESTNFFNITNSFNTEKKYIPPSGKVLDKNDLTNLIDSSMDMWLTAGRFSEQFEHNLADKIGTKYALAVNSGSSANLLAVSALCSPLLNDRQIKPGDEIITVAAGFPTTVAPIIQNGLVPVFVDIEPGTYNVIPEQIEDALTRKTKAVFLAHTLGNPFNLNEVKKICKKNNLWLIEDNCDALGAKYKNQHTGTFGDISTCSFYPAHHITTGEGGSVLTDNPVLYKIIMSLRDWGRDCWCPPGLNNSCNTRFSQKHGTLPLGYDHKYVYSHLGYNLKITDWQAAVGLTQLEKLDNFINMRNKNFKLLKEKLEKVSEYIILPVPEKNSEPSWFGFLISVKEKSPFTKQQLVEHLENNGIGTRNLFAGNILRQPVFINNSYKFRIKNSELLYSDKIEEKQYKLLPNTDFIMNNTFWVGVYPGLENEHINYIIKQILFFIK